jgi:hypothetical protein
MGFRFISPITQTVTSRFGHVLAFTAGVATHVPLEAQPEVIAKGCTPDGTELGGDEATAQAAAIAAAAVLKQAALANTALEEQDGLRGETNAVPSAVPGSTVN